MNLRTDAIIAARRVRPRSHTRNPELPLACEVLNRRIVGKSITAANIIQPGGPIVVRWHARLHPFRKRTSLKPDEIERLYDGMRTCLLEATEKARAVMGEDIH